MDQNGIFDSIIVGGGPAGLAAGMHLARMGYRAVLVERRSTGGQARCIGRLENYPGFPRGVRGDRLMDLWLDQARRWGLPVLMDEATAVARAGGGFSVSLKKGKMLRAGSFIWCGGAEFRKLGVPGEKRFTGRGVWNTAHEAPDCAGKDVAVVGSGEAAVQQALQLCARARSVSLLTRPGQPRAHRLLLRRLAKSKVRLMPGLEVKRVCGGRRLTLELKPGSGGRSRSKLEVAALFVLIGKDPRRAPAVWRRGPSGFFEAGDAASGMFRQVAVAGGDGVRAAMRCAAYLEKARGL